MTCTPDRPNGDERKERTVLPNNAMQLTKGGWMRVEAPSSARAIVLVGEVVRPSQLIASVRRTQSRSAKGSKRGRRGRQWGR
jgi:hypothetical protein